jgi:signal transduction histidine kinase
MDLDTVMFSNVMKIARTVRREALIAFLALVLIVAFHGCVAEDRFLLLLYYIGISAAAYLLLKRGALAWTVIVVSVAAGTTLGYLYFEAPRDSGGRLLYQLRDFAAFCALIALCSRLAIDAYKSQCHEQRIRVQREIAEAAIATRAAALTCTSHEVRTPVAAIITMTDLLLDNSAGELTPEQREIDRCGKHLMALVNDILDYAKAQAGRIKLVFETVSLPDLIAQCVAISAVSGKAKGVELVQQIDAGIGEMFADPLRLKQIILNLLSNAVKYSPQDSVVRIHARLKDGMILISVRDAGRGISDEDLRTLFNPYKQAAKEDRGIGTGLGLAITKLLVELHGGTLLVDSAPGAGSLFTARLPVQSHGDSAELQAWTQIALPLTEESNQLAEMAL